MQLKVEVALLHALQAVEVFLADPVLLLRP